MKKLILTLATIFFVVSSRSQTGLYLQAGSNFYISAGTVVSIDSLVLTPSVDYNISSANRIQRGTIVAHTLSRPYISRVYRLNNTLTGYSGKITMYYQDYELNGIPENVLNLDVYNGSSWNLYSANVNRNATNNFVATNGLSNISINELTLVNSASANAVSIQSNNQKVASFVLQQNIPNPFNHTTTINYTLPQTCSSAEIVVTDKAGKVLKEVNLPVKSTGSLELDASTFASGAYQYSLIVDGRIIDTKQMIHSK